MGNKGLCLTLLISIIALTGCKPDAPVKTTGEAPRPLQTTVWKLTQLDVEGAPAALTDIPQDSHVGFVIFNAQDQSLIGFAGCQQIDGRYSVAGERLTISELVATGTRCHNPRFDRIGDRFMQALRESTVYRLGSDDARLELRTGDTLRAVLLYRTPKEFKW